MSRTYRRKHAEATQGVSTYKWSKQFGWYGDRQWNDNHEYVWVMPTPRELFKKWYYHHGDHKNYESPPPKWYRKETKRSEKNDCKRQFNRWLHNPDFEIVNNEKMRFDNWGWY